MIRKRTGLLVLLAVSMGVYFIFSKVQNPLPSQSMVRHSHHSMKNHMVDEAEVFNDYDRKKFQQYMHWIFQESDIDIRFVFLNALDGRTIEEAAVEKMDALGIGGSTREERGVLLLYVLEEKMLRIEVGYGLEAYFPDAFVAYLMDDHTRFFFASGDLTTGLRLLIRMLHHRIRCAILAKDFDPQLVDILRRTRHLSGGGGATAAMPASGQSSPDPSDGKNKDKASGYQPGETPGITYQRYLEWLFNGIYLTDLGLFTPETRAYMASLPITPAYFHYILIQEYGRQFKIDIRDNRALLYFVDDPMVSPHFFIKTDKGWQMDLYAEAKNIRNRAGGIYTWDYQGSNDEYTRTFLDQLVNINNYIRLKGGDNRPLPVRTQRSQ